MQPCLVLVGSMFWIANLYLVHTLGVVFKRAETLACGVLRHTPGRHHNTPQAQCGQVGWSTTSTKSQPPFSLVSLQLLAPAGRVAVPRMAS